MENIDFASPDRFFNRELSWLEFNRRVLKEAENPRYPLLERLKFLAISGSNLQEFYMVRYAGLKAQLRAGINLLSDDGKSVKERIRMVRQASDNIHAEQSVIFKSLLKELKSQNIEISKIKNLEKEDIKWLEEKFTTDIFPLITPIIKNADNEFPLLLNQEQTLILSLKDKAEDSCAEQKVLIPLPNILNRFIRLPGNKIRFLPVEEAIVLFINRLFPDKEITGKGVFYLVRDSIVEFDERADDLVKGFEIALERRKRGSVVCLVIDRKTPEDLIRFIAEDVYVDSEDIVLIDGFIGIKQLMNIEIPERPDLSFKEHKPVKVTKFKNFSGDFFAALAKKDMLVHHPYESFEVVVQFLKQAAKDKDVISIKQTLYRTNKNSPIISALIQAAENGKDVVAVVELRARFDEEANIKWARDLEKAGVKVFFGLREYKTHSKMSLISRKEAKGIKTYAHFGTGNYNPDTAGTYTDLSFFTCDKDICLDAMHIFNYLTGGTPPSDLRKITLSPLSLRGKVISLIENEIANAQKGKPAHIWAKMNALVDSCIVDALYRASRAGVSIDLLVRGICVLRPGTKGLSENIRVKSITGRFLEHARIFCFGDGHELPSKKAKVYISSADWMYRNMLERVETLIPITDEAIHYRIMNEIMGAEIKDKAQSWILDKDMQYRRLNPESSKKAFSCQDFFCNSPNLSASERSKILRKAGEKQ